MGLSQILISILIIIVTPGLFKIALLLRRQFVSFHKIPGPPSAHWFWGDFVQDGDISIHEKWIAEYGSTFKIHWILNKPQLFTADLRGLQHVLSHSTIYQKPSVISQSLSRVMGRGVLFVEGDQHKNQRRIMNPAFGPIQIRGLTNIFTEKANQLREVLSEEVEASDYNGRTDIMNGLNKATLDVIGLAGFNYEFNALNPTGKPNELHQAFQQFGAKQRVSLVTLFNAIFPALGPIFRIFPSEARRQAAIAQQTKTIDRIALQLLNQSKLTVASAEKDGEKRTGRDILSLLVHANTDKSLPDELRLSDEDVCAQVATFFVAGQETSSTATMWALFALTQAPQCQAKLREELLNVTTDTPSMEELNNLPYLDAVVREASRVHSPVPVTARIAKEDDVIPLEVPFVDIDGETQTNIKITKGDYLMIPIHSVNKSEKIWGKDAAQFRPERWESPPDAARKIPGVWGNQLTFLGGPRACIGYKFAVVEIKALLFALIRAFEFELAVPVDDIKVKRHVVSRPTLASDPEGGFQLPLKVKPYVP